MPTLDAHWKISTKETRHFANVIEAMWCIRQERFARSSFLARLLASLSRNSLRGDQRSPMPEGLAGFEALSFFPAISDYCEEKCIATTSGCFAVCNRSDRAPATTNDARKRKLPGVLVFWTLIRFVGPRPVRPERRVSRASRAREAQGEQSSPVSLRAYRESLRVN
jgi:hypothetical protein